jgi:hypothetical protein
MGLNWKTVQAEHVRKACEVVLATTGKRAAKHRGLFVEFKGAELPAKQVLATAYRFANGLPSGAKLRFSSGDATISRLRSLGFVAGRRGTEEHQGSEENATT